LENAEQLKAYLESKSATVNPVFVKELARGGEAVVYRIEHTGLDEVVAKCTLRSDASTLMDLMRETHMLKLLHNEDCICQVKEEIVEIDEKTQQVTNYCAIVE